MVDPRHGVIGFALLGCGVGCGVGEGGNPQIGHASQYVAFVLMVRYTRRIVVWARFECPGVVPSMSGICGLVAWDCGMAFGEIATYPVVGAIVDMTCGFPCADLP